MTDKRPKGSTAIIVRHAFTTANTYAKPFNTDDNQINSADRGQISCDGPRPRAQTTSAFNHAENYDTVFTSARLWAYNKGRFYQNKNNQNKNMHVKARYADGLVSCKAPP